MANERKLYAYDGRNSVVSLYDAYAAILTRPIESFVHVEGCSHGLNGNLLVEENIGKKFKVSILDPYEVGECIFLGIGFDAIPFEWVQDQLKDEGLYLSHCLVFGVFNSDCLVIIPLPVACDVEPLF